MAEWKFIGARRYECSACGEGVPDMPCDWYSGEPLYNFCPYCGANMNMKKACEDCQEFSCDYCPNCGADMRGKQDE